MATPDIHPRDDMLSKTRLLVTFGLLAALVLCLVFAWSTRDAMARLPFLEGGAAGQSSLVDLSPWQTAQALAGLAVSAEEAGFAREAERLADHEVDQAFATALRQAGKQNRSLSAEAQALAKKRDRFKAIVQEDQARVQSLTRATASSNNGGDDLDIAKAQLALDTDELADAQQDLARAGGDERAKIQQELAAHESAMKAYDAHAGSKGENAVASAQQQHGSLASQMREWIHQRTRAQLIQRAMRQAQDDAAALTTRHKQLEKQAYAAPPGPNPASPAADKAATLASLRDRSEQSQLLGIYDDRIETERQLAAVYRKWSEHLLLQHRILLHLMLQSFALIAFVLICVILFDALVRYLIQRHGLDRRRMQTLRVIFRFGIQLLGVLVILMVIFGAPSQTPTIVGLTTAGLTVVLQDFILAFFGWFVLMGRNGIRIGDWVEINGVGGEVVEIGIFRTALLETGNWTDKGHPTGRRVTMINSFAIKGQYFNFSTAGQWMWDQITLSIPEYDDPYGVIELVRQAVVKETEADTRLAEEEWKHVTRRNGMSQFSASPAVDIRPGIAGIDVTIRYVTRASDRLEVRNRLYQCVIGLLHQSVTPRPQMEQPAPANS